MAEVVPVRCPACRREHAYTPATFPCACGEPLTVPVLARGVATRVRQRMWKDSWVRVRCGRCGRADEWPRPEVSCACGVVIRPAVVYGGDGAPVPGAEGRPADGAVPVPRAVRRPVFEPLTIRTGRDAVAAAACYLRWLGFAGVVLDRDRAVSGVDVRGAGVLARVAASTRQPPPSEVETLWLACLHAGAAGALFSLAGYGRETRAVADRLGVSLFVLDLTGTPRPVNAAADRLIRTPPTG